VHALFNLDIQVSLFFIPNVGGVHCRSASRDHDATQSLSSILRQHVTFKVSTM
jgi:hypothetical protein